MVKRISSRVWSILISALALAGLQVPAKGLRAQESPSSAGAQLEIVRPSRNKKLFLQLAKPSNAESFAVAGHTSHSSHRSHSSHQSHSSHYSGSSGGSTYTPPYTPPTPAPKPTPTPTPKPVMTPVDPSGQGAAGSVFEKGVYNKFVRFEQMEDNPLALECVKRGIGVTQQKLREGYFELVVLSDQNPITVSVKYYSNAGEARIGKYIHPGSPGTLNANFVQWLVNNAWPEAPRTK